jgi:hypothetical protein
MVGSQGFYEESRDLFPWTPRQEAWIEAAFWIAEEKRARLRGNPTKEAFARLASNTACSRPKTSILASGPVRYPYPNFALAEFFEVGLPEFRVLGSPHSPGPA